ncbi:MAG: hypothetical protein AMJ92_04090 [candidate division Zixibacteria bacterium SM23_81]|nr:MAG: hypothetical protein AMJ92_04090 [candidate division Zixibacteria bacterium SM23_81]
MRETRSRIVIFKLAAFQLLATNFKHTKYLRGVLSQGLERFPPSLRLRQKCAKNILTLGYPAGIMCTMSEANISSYDTHNGLELGFPLFPITY